MNLKRIPPLLALTFGTMVLGGVLAAAGYQQFAQSSNNDDKRQGKSLSGSYLLPLTRLSEFLKDELHIRVDDHGFNLGGVGSDLWQGPEDGSDEFWMITDRGPNGQIRVPPVTGANRRTFPIPEFTPFILNVRAKNGKLEIKNAIPLSGWEHGRRPVTGLSNTLPRDEQPYDCSAQIPGALNVHGLDTEGLVRTRHGTFWVDEEYSPSILVIDRFGFVLRRFVPQGLALGTTLYDTIDTLPAIYLRRKVNRGFEGLALSPDERTVYAALQSPLLNPNSAIGNASRNTRILAFSTTHEAPTAEYVYRFQDVSEFNHTDPAEMKVSAVVMLNRRHMLVLERTDLIAKVYLVNLSQATDILGTKWDTPAASPADPNLESLDDAGLADNQIVPLPKTLIATFDSTTPNSAYPQKIEGLAVLDERTLAIANDNDFGIGTFDLAPPCTLIDSNVRSRVQIVKLDRALPGTGRDRDDR